MSATADAVIAPGVPARIGRYEIVGHLADGGMAEILLGRVPGESGFARAVVIKRILHHLARTPEFEAMFLDEARIVSEIHHPNVVQVFDLGRDGGELFLVMEYLEGESAAGLMRRLTLLEERLDPHLAAHIVAEICAGLHAAHELPDDHGDCRNLVHRDVSPQNVFIGYEGTVKLLDFGIAKTADRLGRTVAGQLKGKYGYMSPEQCRGKPLDRRSDIFALGTVLYELGTGHRLFSRATEMHTFNAICRERIVPPSEVRSDFPSSLETICMRALRRSAAERYATAAEMRRDLLRAASEARPAEPLDERLAMLMRRVFADRIEEKAELMRLVRTGRTVTSIPRAEADVDARIPTVADGAESTVTTRLDANVAPRGVTRRRWPLVAAAGALAAVGVTAAFRFDRRSAPPNLAEATAATQPSTAQLVPPAPTDPATSTPTGDSVTLRIETDPPGASVLLSGSREGQAPIELRVARSSEPVDLEVQLSGHAPRTERIVPDHDLALRWTLTRLAPVRAQPKAASTPPAPTASGPAAAPATSSAPPDYYKF